MRVRVRVRGRGRVRAREGGLHGGRALLPLAAVCRAPRRHVPRHPRYGVVRLRLTHVHQPQPQLERRAGVARGSPARGVIISHARRLERAREGDGVWLGLGLGVRARADPRLTLG